MADRRSESRRWAGRPLAMVCVLLSCACAADHEAFDRNIALFDELAFGGPFDSDLPRRDRIVKWTGALHVAIVGDPADKHAALVRKALEKISVLSRLPLDLQPIRNVETNYVVRFIPQESIAVRNDHVGCLVSVREHGGVIGRAIVTISLADETRIGRCIAHETMHSMGFGYHSAAVRSILSPVHEETSFTVWDELMIRTLYDDRLAPNMPRAAAMEVARGILGTALAGE